MDLRRIALGGLVALPLAVGGGLAVTQLYVPGMVRERLDAVARERLGLSAKVGSVSVGLGSVELRDVVIGDSTGGVRIGMPRVQLEGSPLLVALRGPRHFDAIRVEGADVELMGDSPGAVRLRERLAGARKAAAEGAATAGSLPGLEAAGLTVKIADGLGPLVSVAGGTVKLIDGKLDVGAASLRLGSADSHRLSLEGCRATLGRESGRLFLQTAAVRQAQLELVEPKAPPPAVPGAAAAGVEAGLTAHRGLVERLRALLAERASTQAAPPGDKPPADAAQGPDGPWASFERTRSLTLGSGRVMGSGGKLLDGLELEASAGDDHALRVKGGGRGANGGKLLWDMRVWPKDLRADGTLELDGLSLGLIAPLLPSIPWHEPEHATVSARIVVKAESVQRLALNGRAELNGAAIASERVAPVPITGIDFGVEGEGHWLPLQRRLEVDSARVTLGAAVADVAGAVEWASDHYLLALDVTVPRMPCTEAIRALPRDLLADMAQAEFSGTIAGKLHLALDSQSLQQGELEFDVEDRCEFVAVPVMADLRRFKMPFVHSVVEPDGSLFEMDTGPGTAKWTYLEDISPFLVHAVLAHEDAQFFTHQGFAPAHIRNALIRNLEEGRYVVGASTVTMQLVKNVFLRREKTLARKIQEVLLTWWIERVLEKREIIELYLNVIEYGPGVYGIRDGAKHYFNRLPSELSPAEAVYLSTILPNPKRYHAAFERGSLSPGWIDKMRKIFKRMRERGWYDAQATAFGLQELNGFRFVPEGSIAPPRHVVGKAAALPYELPAGEAWESWPSDGEPPPADEWGGDGEAGETGETGEEP